LKQKPKIDVALEYVLRQITVKPKLALILGSGLGNFGSKIDVSNILKSEDIPHYPQSSVQGHAGRLIFGHLRLGSRISIPLLVFQGRVHFYECESLERVTFPVLLAKKLGIKKLIVTNAAGGINANFKAGDLMLIRDIINLTQMGCPQIGRDGVPKRLFNVNLQKTVLECSKMLGIPLQEGTYCWLKGPSYETPSEIQMLKKLGIDAVGMSTVPEIFTASRLQMDIVGISLISNMGAGISPTKLSHTEVTETANSVQERFSELMSHVVISLR
jgi:purine-nucleoside phosphorylase